MKHILFVFYIFVLSTHLVADDFETMAKESYRDQDYNKALVYYEKIYKQSPTVIDTLYNLGNVHFKLGNIGKAIGYYRQVLIADPLDSDTRYNILLARQLVVDDISQENSVWNTLLARFQLISMNGSFYLFMVVLFSLVGILLTYKKATQYKEVWFNLGVFMAVGTLLFGGVFLFKYSQFHQSYGVAVDKKVSVHSGPSDTLPVLFYIHEGHELKITKQTKMWNEVILSNGFKGWAHSDQFFVITN